MSLTSYRKKRRFERTPEPKGRREQAQGALRFVVQKHDASRLHYDFRLEMDGVLKSWAVPKGPSLNPVDKRLAVMVEDHPLDYGGFEGVIPEGNYGAGTVMVWDRGTYEPVAAARRAEREKKLLGELKDGHLRFVLHGKKLRGEFSLVRMRGGKGNEWLLLKHRDAFAEETDVLTRDRSVASRRGMAAIAKHAVDRKQVWKSNGKPKKSSPGPRPAARHKPMLATLVAAPFDRAGWLFEIKWDGYRALAEVDGNDVRLYSRNQLSFERRFGPVVAALRKLKKCAVFDGEVVVLDEQGKSRFQLLQNYQRTGQGNLAYCIFDLLELDGADLRAEPLRRRKELLAPLLAGNPVLRFSEHIEEHGVSFFQAAIKQGLEGIIAKNGASPYREGMRGMDWLKIKARQRQEAVIGGFTEPRGSRQSLGALLLGVYEDSDLVYIGHAGGGFDSKSLAVVHARLQPLVQTTCPFRTRPKANAPAHWVKPIQVCEVEFQEWTDEGAMRQPIFVGLRDDKPARDVTREVSMPVSEVRTNGKPRARANAARGAVPARHKRPLQSALPAGTYTNLDKIYWPGDGFTKGDLLQYYHEVAPLMLPHLRDRPLSLHRFPDGIHGASFFQKDVGKQPPPKGVATMTLDVESKHKKIRAILCQDEATLLYAANLGCIEVNVWNSRHDSLDRPDYLVIDLDPQDVPFPEVVATAQAVRKLLEKRCAECYCKTSGKRGLHIYVPLSARYDYDQVRGFAEIIARLIHKERPQSTSLERSPAQRRGLIYLDFLQNRRGATMASPYSVRPVAGACVSTPLRWSEVTKKLNPAEFTIANVPRRLHKLGDLWRPVLQGGADLRKCLEAMN